MAIALYFRRISASDTAEHDTTVTYEYGPDPDRADHRLVIDLVADVVRPVDGQADHSMSRVAGKVLRLHRETGLWPETGGYFA